MVLKQILAKEKQNFYKIYLYINEENNLCYSYEFSAYLLSQLLNTKLEETRKKLGATFYYTQLSIQAVVDQLSGPNTMVGDDVITVVLDNTTHCLQWKLEFDNLKNTQKRFYNKFIVYLRKIFCKRRFLKLNEQNMKA